MRSVQRHLRSGVIAVALVCFFVAALLYTPGIDDPDAYVVREVAVSLPPPPAPPPPAVEVERQASVPLDVSPGTQSLVPELRSEDLVLKVARPTIEAPAVTHTELDADFELTVAWEGFALSELDRIPRLLSEPSLSFPAALERRGVKRVTAELMVVIDERGQVLLREILSSSHAEINAQLPGLVRRSRFTAPQKDGKPVRARFVWPLVFNSERS